MILVVADDFTGAAELAGISLRCGLSTELQSGGVEATDAQVLILDSNTRIVTPEQARRKVCELARAVRGFPTEWVFKKIDSVLRGNVLDELDALCTGLGKSKVLLVPGNPRLGRVVRGGKLFVDGELLDRTPFAQDPEFRVVSSEILTLLGATSRSDVVLADPGDPLPPARIIVAQAECDEDIRLWADKLPDDALAAGASEFFAALLQKNGYEPLDRFEGSDAWRKGRTLVVCGSRTRDTLSALGAPADSELVVLESPGPLGVSHEASVEKWVGATVEKLERVGWVLLCPDIELVSRSANHGLLHYLAQLVEGVLSRTHVDEIVIEGGSTASAVVGRLGWKRWTPVAELAPGVVRLKHRGYPHQFLTVKPGSYRWPSGMRHTAA